MLCVYGVNDGKADIFQRGFHDFSRVLLVASPFSSDTKMRLVRADWTNPSSRSTRGAATATIAVQQYIEKYRNFNRLHHSCLIFVSQVELWMFFPFIISKRAHNS